MQHKYDRGSFQSFSIGKTATQLFAANPSRVGLVLGSSLVASYYISNNSNVASGTGLQITLDYPPVILRVEQVGDWIQGDIFAVGDSSITTFAACEVLCPCQTPEPAL